MPSFDTDTTDKIVLLRGLRTLGTAIEGPYELVKIEWPTPTGTTYYATTAVDEVASKPPPVAVDLRLITENDPNSFVPVVIDSTIGDEEVDLTFWDADDAISDLVNMHGEGLRVTLLYWFPQVELLLPVWEGHLRFEDEGEIDILKLKAVQGFRSSDANIPGRGHTPYCQAVFGGLFTTQEEIDEGGCNYNRQIPGGTVGTLDPDTGQPWTFCPRRDTNDCILRGINPLRHLSHRTMIKTIVNTQSSGARLLSTSQGNETNLSEAVRVVMGTRRVYDMKVMVFRKDRNLNDPDRGWYQAFYEACEGPIESITQARIKVGDIEKNADPLHYGARLGNFGDVSADIGLTPHGFSATSYIRYAYGWIDPEPIDPEDANANAVIRGLRDVRTYQNVDEDDNGLIATFFLGSDFTTNEVGKKRISNVNFPTTFDPPFAGLPNHGWCAEITGEISFPHSGNWTIKGEHDDGMYVEIDGGVIFDELTNNGTHTGVFNAPAADTRYPITIRFIQETFHWFQILKWSHASQSEQVVPGDRLFLGFTGQLVLKQPTSNRVWQIARMLCDKRWGHGYDYDRLAIESWIETAQWVEPWVRFTDALGNHWDHQRGMSDVELIERKSQQQIEDMCVAGRLSRPFLFDGKIHIMPLRALSQAELDACPEFTDTGENRNIVWEGDEGEEKSSLRFKRKSSHELTNRVECTADLASEDYKKTPLQPVEDIDAQLRAGRVLGDHSKKVEPKKEHLLGVVSEPHGMKLAWSILDLGKLDEGGLQNNLTVMFKIWFLDALDLHVFKVIKVTSSRIAKYGFTHFRILRMERSDNLHYELTVQAYNQAFMDSFETLLTDIPGSPPEPPVPGPPPEPPPQCILEFGTITYTDGILDVPIPQCAGDEAILDGGSFDTVFAHGVDAGAFSSSFTEGYAGGEL